MRRSMARTGGARRRSRLARRIGIASVLLASSALAVVPPVAAGSPGYRVTGDLQAISGPGAWTGSGITWFDKSPALARLSSPTFYVLHAGAGGKTTLTLEAITTPVSAVEVAINTTTGDQLIAVGPDSGLTSSDAMATSTAIGPARASGQGVAGLTTSHKSGWFYTEWSDPFYIPVSTVKTSIDWYYDGYETTSFTGGDYRTWFSANGWHEIYHTLSAHWDRTETKGVLDTGDRMQTSSWFPLPTCGTSTIYYSYNEVVGYGDGHVDGNVTTWITSGCAALLTWNAGAGYN